LRKAGNSAADGSLVFTRSLTLYELDGEAANRADQQSVNEAAVMQQKLFDHPKREKK
jgi:hypothetical protein